MSPQQTIALLQDWLKLEESKKHSMAVKYIEENVDLIDTDQQKFMDDCPSACQLEVYQMLLKAGIDMKEYSFTGSIKQWEQYLHDVNTYSHKYYTINYKQDLDDYIDQMLTWKTDWRHDSIVLDTIPAIKEG